jgi:hypothetical protein
MMPEHKGVRQMPATELDCFGYQMQPQLEQEPVSRHYLKVNIKEASPAEQLELELFINLAPSSTHKNPNSIFS